MRFLADENVPGECVAALKLAGHDVVWVRTAAPGITDAEVLAWAAREERLLVTFDKDFGELARRSELPPTSGVILFRTSMPQRGVARQFADLLTSRSDWAGHFSIIEPGRIRMRLLAPE